MMANCVGKRLSELGAICYTTAVGFALSYYQKRMMMMIILMVVLGALKQRRQTNQNIQ